MGWGGDDERYYAEIICLRSRVHAMTPCGNYGFRVKGGRFGCSLRSAILLIGGDKTGDDRFYDTYIPIADRLYDQHLQELREEGLI